MQYDLKDQVDVNNFEVKYQSYSNNSNYKFALIDNQIKLYQNKN